AIRVAATVTPIKTNNLASVTQRLDERLAPLLAAGDDLEFVAAGDSARPFAAAPVRRARRVQVSSDIAGPGAGPIRRSRNSTNPDSGSKGPVAFRLPRTDWGVPSRPSRTDCRIASVLPLMVRAMPSGSV